MKQIDRDDITADIYRDILDTETHHEHDIVEDDNGILRWKANPEVNLILDKIDLNDLTLLLRKLGIDKNSEEYRYMYRCMGYSLHGYWELFYWEVNNPNKDKYKPQFIKK